MSLFVPAGARLAHQLPVWHEIVSAMPSNAGRILGEASCHDDPAPRSVISTSRPHWALCAGAQALPVMVTPYATGIATWPLALLHRWHRGDTFTLRLIWLVLAALSLLLTFRVIARVQDPATAALACAMVAASAPFLVINALLVPYETLPCTLMVAAISAWSGIAEPAPRPARLYGGALLAGLSVASNVKALFLLVPVILIAWRAGVRPGAIGRRRAALMAALFLLPAAPMIVFAAIDPQHGFLDQVVRRGSYITQNLRLGRFVSEPLLLFNFTVDTGSILDLAQGASARWGVAHVAAGLPIVYCMVVGAARLFGRRWGSPLAGACGAIVLALFGVSILLYRQYPGGNYAPLHDVLGLAMAAGVVDAARRLAGRRWLPFAAAGVLLLAVLSLALTLRRDYRRSVAFSINSDALRAMAAHLRASPTPSLVLSTTYNLSGVIDALGRGRVREARVSEELRGCDRPDGDLDACMTQAWLRLLSRVPLPVRVLLPLSTAPVDKPVEIARRIQPTLEGAAGRLGHVVALEGRFSTADGLPVLALYRISRR